MTTNAPYGPGNPPPETDSPDIARILCTARIMCTAKQPAGEGRSRVGFSAGPGFPNGQTAVIGAIGLSTVMPAEAARHFVIGRPVTLVFTDGEVG